MRVNRDDPAFASPSKPIGGFLDEDAAHRFEAEGWPVIEDAGRGWRRVVASPAPVEIIEQQAIAEAAASGWIVIAAGGGGIPVTRNLAGELRGVPAVIDKDLASGLLASRLGADLLLISTSVEHVSLHFGTPQQQDIERMTVVEARRYQNEGHFAPGSMKPKIEACIRFLEQHSRADARCIITNPENLEHAVYGHTGTHIVRA